MVTYQKLPKTYRLFVYDQPDHGVVGASVGPRYGGSGFIGELFNKLNKIGTPYNGAPVSAVARSEAPRNPLIDSSWLVGKEFPQVLVNLFIHGDWTTLEIISPDPKTTAKDLPTDLVKIINEYEYKLEHK